MNKPSNKKKNDTDKGILQAIAAVDRPWQFGIKSNYIVDTSEF